MDNSNESRDLNKTEQRLALQLARQTLENYFLGKDISIDLSSFPIFRQPRGVFVTLHKKDTGKLRGCVGQVVAVEPLGEAIKQMAIAAAIDDPRFPPLTHAELNQVRIEISVLSPLRKIDFPDQIELGKHGVLIRQGLKSGVFLPQVAKETGWDLATFMSRLCTDKAGLEPDAWQNGSVEIYIFTVQTFTENDS